jgi:hypothetical protein
MKKRGGNTVRIAKEKHISQVEYCYIGRDKDFNAFLKSVIQDYLSDSVEAVSGPPLVGLVELSALQNHSLDLSKSL